MTTTIHHRRHGKHVATPVATVVAEPIAAAVVLEKQSSAASGMAILARAMSSGHGYKGTFEDATKLIQEYQAICARIAQLTNATAGRAAAEAQLAKLQARTLELEGSLRKNKSIEVQVEARLQRNANPHFLHYLQIDREGKVRRLQQELADLRTQAARIDADLKQIGQDTATVRTTISSLQNQEAELRSVNLDKQRVRNRIVGLAPNADYVQQLKAQRGDLEGTVAAETQLLQQLNAVMAQVNNARQLFNQAHVALDRAQRDNYRAEREAEFDTWANWGDADYAEVGLQRDRDRMINQAKRLAFDAGNVLQAAFDAFPMEARVRFPDITRNVCNAPIPRLEGANFGNALNADFWGGAYGALNNDFRAERKIDRDLYILRQCENLAAEQSSAVAAVLTSIDMEIRNLRAKASALASTIEKQENEAIEVVSQSANASFQPQSYNAHVLSAQAAF